MSEDLIHIVFDTETLGLYQDAIVLSIGAAVFKFDGKTPDYDAIVRSGFHVKFNVDEQIRKYGRKTTESTLEWWKTASPEARAILKPTPQDMGMLEGLDQLNSWIRDSGYNFKESFVWSRGTYFDFPKMEHMYDQVGIRPAYNGWKIRDTRTFIDTLLGTNRGQYEPRNKPASFVMHDALHDAAMDAYRLQDLFNAVTEE